LNGDNRQIDRKIADLLSSIFIAAVDRHDSEPVRAFASHHLDQTIKGIAFKEIRGLGLSVKITVRNLLDKPEGNRADRKTRRRPGGD
jgi:hypothetical protein